MKKIKLLVGIVLLAASSVFGQTEKFEALDNPGKVLQSLQKVSAATTSIVASFTETKYIAVLSEPQKASGKMYYAQQDKMKWVQEKPFEYIILINGESLRIKDNGKEREFNEGGKVAARINKFMMGLIQGDYQDNKAYDSKFKASNESYLVELVPTVKSLSKIYDKLELYFSKKDNRLYKIIFYEAGGDQRNVEFYDQKYNTTISQAVFENL